MTLYIVALFLLLNKINMFNNQFKNIQQNKISKRCLQDQNYFCNDFCLSFKNFFILIF